MTNATKQQNTVGAKTAGISNGVKALHTINRVTKSASARVGRGGKRGKTSGRGTKGQKARAGHSLRPEMRDTIKKIPKLRGHGKNRARTVNSSRVKPVVVSLAALEHAFAAGDSVTLTTLAEKGIVSTRAGKPLAAKIVAGGELTKKLVVSGITTSAAAKVAIEGAGGTIAE